MADVRMRLAIVALALAACVQPTGNASGQGGTTPTTCSTDQDCTLYDCTCADGTMQPKQQACTSGHCADGQTVCSLPCQTNGGVAAAQQRINVIGSAECTAFCDKVDALPCSKAKGGTATCGAGWNCSVNDFNGSCAESVREVLACDVQMAAFSCAGDAWTITSPCGPNSAACQ